MDILQLKYFLAAAETEHVTKAAKSLNIAQPALSQSIKHLETELGVKLFDRKNRGFRLNANGKMLRDELIPILDRLNSLPARLQENEKQASKTIRLNILAASSLVTQSIISFKKLYPDVNFHLQQNSENIDSDISISCTASKQIPDHAIHLLTEKILLVVPEDGPYANLAQISLNQVRHEGFISFSHSKPLRTICDFYCKQAGFQPKIIFESDNQESVRNLIDSSLGIAFWPQYAFGKFTAKQSVMIPICEPDCTRTIYVTCNNNPINREYTEAFLKYLRKFIKEITDSE